ncbi:MAG: DUF2530 domain-containing protein [Candidatus Nanopelagicales bacterium]
MGPTGLPHDPADYGVGAAKVGAVVWAVALFGAIVARAWLREHDAEWFLATAVVGLTIGLVMLVLFRRRRAVYEAHR